MPRFWCAVCEREPEQVLPGPCGCELVVCHGASETATDESAPGGIVFNSEAWKQRKRRSNEFVEQLTRDMNRKRPSYYARALWLWKGRRR